MKMIHLSDLHLGKRVHEYSMLEEQVYILEQIVAIVDSEVPDCVLIAGDIYDKPMPPAEAVAVLDNFLTALSSRGIPVFLISGNHDSAERLAFGARFMQKSGIYPAQVYDGTITPIVLELEDGPVHIYMLPFLKPAHVRRFFPEEEIVTCTDALRVVISHVQLDASVRNVLVTHQFVLGARTTESEEISVGGIDQVDAAVFDDFDYVALGHLHSPQNCTSVRIRYCGTPLKYSFSEVADEKSVTVVNLDEKGTVSVRTVPLVPCHEMRELRGTYTELVSASFYENTTYRDDFVHIILTDEEDVPEALGKLRAVYRNLLKLDYDNTRTRSGDHTGEYAPAERKDPIELFDEFYMLQNNQTMGEEQRMYLRSLIEMIWEGEA